MEEVEKIFPDFDLFEGIEIDDVNDMKSNKVYHLFYLTKVRVKGEDGLWYLTSIINRQVKEFEVDSFNEAWAVGKEFKNEFIKECIKDSYNLLMFGKVDINLLDIYGSPSFNLDKNQEENKPK